LKRSGDMKICTILGKRGRVTLPQEIRQELEFEYGDIISFEHRGDAVTVRREKVCDGCRTVKPDPKPNRVEVLNGLLESLTAAELRTALIHLSVKWAEMTGPQHDPANGSADDA